MKWKKAAHTVCYSWKTSSNLGFPVPDYFNGFSLYLKKIYKSRIIAFNSAGIALKCLLSITFFL